MASYRGILWIPAGSVDWQFGSVWKMLRCRKNNFLCPRCCPKHGQFGVKIPGSFCLVWKIHVGTVLWPMACSSLETAPGRTIWPTMRSCEKIWRSANCAWAAKTEHLKTHKKGVQKGSSCPIYEEHQRTSWFLDFLGFMYHQLDVFALTLILSHKWNCKFASLALC